MLRSITCSAALAVMALAAPAVSAATAEGNTTHIRYHDLDLSTAAGVKSLNRRVRAAAADVCEYDEAWKSRRLDSALRCMRVAMEGAKSQVEKVVAMRGQTIRRAETPAAITVVS